jgi:hypothetical protein
MSDQIELSEILSGSTPDGVPIEREERAAPEPAAPVEKAEAVEAAPIEKVQSRKKAFQQKERDTREAGNGRVRDPETGQYVPKAAEPVAETPVTEVKAETPEPAPQQSVKEPPKQEFTEKERAFLAAAQEERRKRQALEHQLGKRQKELKSIGNLEEYRANIERETRAKLEAEYKAKEEERRKLAADLPTSLSDVRGSNPSNRVVFAGPPSFEDILSGR